MVSGTQSCCGSVVISTLQPRKVFKIHSSNVMVSHIAIFSDVFPARNLSLVFSIRSTISLLTFIVSCPFSRASSGENVDCSLLVCCIWGECCFSESCNFCALLPLPSWVKKVSLVVADLS
jgi:hypothetical protein